MKPLISCPFCGKRRATRLCDAPVMRYRYCGHPPRSSLVRSFDPMIWTEPMQGVYTCDRPICDACTVEVAPEIDYCPRCIQRIKMKAGEKRRKL